MERMGQNLGNLQATRLPLQQETKGAKKTQPVIRARPFDSAQGRLDRAAALVNHVLIRVIRAIHG